MLIVIVVSSKEGQKQYMHDKMKISASSNVNANPQDHSITYITLNRGSRVQLGVWTQHINFTLQTHQV